MDSDHFPSSFHGNTSNVHGNAMPDHRSSPTRRVNKLSADAITRKYSQNFRSRNSLYNGHSSHSPGQKSASAYQNGYKEREKGVKFSNVTIYSFAREQGFSSIPDSGWCTLGMAQKHFSVSRFDLHQHRILQRLRKRQRRLLSQKNRLANGTLQGRIRCRGKAKFKNQQMDAEFSGRSPGDSCRVPVFSSPPPLSPQPNNERFTHVDPVDSPLISLGICAQATPPPPCLSPPSPRRFLGSVDDSLVNANSFTTFDTLDTDSEASLDHTPSISSPGRLRNGKTREKLMPIHSAARVRLLRSSGVTQLDESERLVCSFVRATRARVGCSCGPRHPCSPEHCSCCQDGVPCQVDRESFPCSCLANKCYNPNGRNEFFREQVRAHAQHVLTRFSQDSISKPNGSFSHPDPVPLSGYSSPIAIPLSPPPTGDNIDILSTPSGACPICVKCPVSTSRNTPGIQPNGQNDSGLLRLSTDLVTNRIPSHSRSNRTPIQKRKSDLPFLPDCAHSTPLVDATKPIQTHEGDQLPSKLSKSNGSLGFSPNPLSGLDSGTDSKLDLPKSPVPRSPDFRSSPTRIGLRDRTALSSTTNNTTTTSPTKWATQVCTRRTHSPNLGTSPTFSNGQYASPTPSNTTTTITTTESPLVLSQSIRSRLSFGSRTKSQSFSETFTDKTQPPIKSKASRMRKSSSAEDLQVSDLYLLTSGLELSSDYPGTPPLSMRCDSPEFQQIKVNFVEDSIASYRRVDSLKESWAISKQDLFASKSAPNSPRPQDQNIHFGRISLRHRAIPRLPVTPSRRIARSPRPQTPIPSRVKTLSRLLFSQNGRPNGLTLPGQEPASCQPTHEPSSLTTGNAISCSELKSEPNQVS